MLSGLIRAVASSTLFTRFVGGLEKLASHRPNMLVVLTYHRVDELGARPHLSPVLHSATPDGFDKQMQYLASKWEVVSVHDVLAAVEQRRPLPPRSVMVTFDDAYRGFGEHAWPILRRHGLPATLFVPTAFPCQLEQAFWWDRLYQAVNSPSRTTLDSPSGPYPIATPDQRKQTFKQLRHYVKSLEHEAAMAWVDDTCRRMGIHSLPCEVLDWDALRFLARQGVTLGAHTRNHPMMNRISAERARDEALGSLADLEREVGRTLPIFAYPSGGFDDRVVDNLAEAGFRLAFTTERGVNDIRSTHPLRLCRINVGRLAPLGMLQAQMLPRRPDLGRLATS